MAKTVMLAEIQWVADERFSDLQIGEHVAVEIEERGEPLPVATIGLTERPLIMLDGSEVSESGISAIPVAPRHDCGLFMCEDFRFHASGENQDGNQFLLLEGKAPAYFRTEGALISKAVLSTLAPLPYSMEATLFEAMSCECASLESKAAFLASAAASLLRSESMESGAAECSIHFFQLAYGLTGRNRYLIEAYQVAKSLGKTLDDFSLPSSRLPWRWRMSALEKAGGLTLLGYSALRLAAVQSFSATSEIDEAIDAINTARKKNEELLDESEAEMLETAVKWLEAKKELGSYRPAEGTCFSNPLATLMRMEAIGAFGARHPSRW